MAPAPAPAPAPPPPAPAATADAVAAVLDERARQLAQRRRVERAAGESHVIAVVGTLTVAVPMSRARRIVASRPLSRLPASGSGLAGIAGVHGAPVPVVDLALLIRGGASETDSDGRLLLVDDQRSTVGLQVDRVTGLAEVERHRLSSDLSSPASRFVAGVAPGGVLVLDIDALLTDPRLWPSGGAGSHETPQPDGGTSR